MKAIGIQNISGVLCVLMLSACSGRDENSYVLKPDRLTVSHHDQISALEDSLVRPVLYENIPNMDGLEVSTLKSKFIGAVLPAILISKFYINQDRERIKRLQLKEEWSEKDSAFYEKKMKLYKAKDMDGLLKRMITHPNSIVLAQAAVESGWGQSRFFQEGNNLFGIWSYKKNEPRMPASFKRGENAIYLRKYEDISGSITDYFQTIGRSSAYRQFRDARANTQEVSTLLPYLKNYSERKMEYVNQLRTIIRQNNFTKYDDYKIDPQYFVYK